MTWRQYLLLIVLGALWGASFLFLRIASPVLGPFIVTAGRLWLALIFIFIYMRLLTTTSLLGHLNWRQCVVLGLVNSAIPFTLISYAEMHVTASFGSVLNGTTPIFTAFLAVVFYQQRFNMIQLLGFLLGIMGVVIIVGWHPISLTREHVTAIIALLIAACSYGVGGLYAANKIKGVPSLTLAFWQQLTGGLLMLPLALWHSPHVLPTTNAVIALLLLGILSTGLAYVIYFKLIVEVGASKTLTVTYLIPLFGVFWGALILNESIHLSLIIGLLVIFLSIYLISRKKQ